MVNPYKQAMGQPGEPEFNPKYLEPGIVAAVMKFREAGFVTHTSCEGHADRGRHIPYVGVILKHEEYPKIKTFLEQLGVETYNIKLQFLWGRRLLREGEWRYYKMLDFDLPSHWLPTHGEYIIVESNEFLNMKGMTPNYGMLTSNDFLPKNMLKGRACDICHEPKPLCKYANICEDCFIENIFDPYDDPYTSVDGTNL